MKKLFLLGAMLFGLAASAQNGHLKFMGREICGSVADFRSYLVAEKGFYRTIDPCILRGTFAEQKCQVRLVKGADGMLFSVEMLSDSSYDNWTPLYRTYCAWVEIYTVKYGNPISAIQSFGSNDDFVRATNSDFARMTAVEDETCNFKTVFSTNGGTIEIAIVKDKDEFGHGKIFIRYCDKLNDKVQRSRILDEI